MPIGERIKFYSALMNGYFYKSAAKYNSVEALFMYQTNE